MKARRPPLKASPLWLDLLSPLCTRNARAQTRPRLVCIDQADFAASLDKVVNVRTILPNDRLLRSGSCNFATIPSGSTARFVGIHRRAPGFMLPLYELCCATTAQRIFAGDGIFRDDAWRVSTECGRSGFDDFCLAPRSCAMLDGFVTDGGVPRYVAVPARCEILRVR